MKAAPRLTQPGASQGERRPSRLMKAPTASLRVWRPSMNSAIMIGMPTMTMHSR